MANAAPIPGGDIRTVCASVGTDNPATSTFTLNADCGEVTSPLTVPDGYTVEGGGHIITATDPVDPFLAPSVQRWRGDECLGRTPDACEQRHHPAVGFAEHAPSNSRPRRSGRTLLRRCRRHRDKRHCPRHHPATPSACQTGNGYPRRRRPGQHARSRSPARSRRAYEERVHRVRAMTLNVSGSTIGPPDALPGVNSTNGVQYGDGGAGDTFTATGDRCRPGTPPDGTNAPESCCPAPPMSRSPTTRSPARAPTRDRGRQQHERHDLQQRRRPHRARLHLTPLEPGFRVFPSPVR